MIPVDKTQIGSQSPALIAHYKIHSACPNDVWLEEMCLHQTGLVCDNEGFGPKWHKKGFSKTKFKKKIMGYILLDNSLYLYNPTQNNCA